VPSVEDFKAQTREKLRDLRCPDHRQAPRVRFHGSTLRCVTIEMTSCCKKLAALANLRIAARENGSGPNPSPYFEVTAQPR